MHPLLMDLEAAAAAIATQPDTARRQAVSGQLPGTRVGGQWRFWAPALVGAVAGPEAASHLAGQLLPPGHVEPGVVDVAELADLLGIAPRTVAGLMRAGTIPARKSGQWRAYWPVIRDRIAAGQPLMDHPAVDPDDTEDHDDEPT